MSFDAGSAVSTLGLDMNPFAQGMLQAQGIAQLFPSVVTNFLADPLLGFAALAKDVAGSVLSAFQEIGHAADDAGEAAEKAGVSASFLTTVGKVADDAGASAEALGDSLKFLNKNAAEAAGGNQDAQKSFADLGISVTDAAGAIKPTEQLFYEVTDAIAALPNAAVKTNAAMGLLGRGGTDMIAFMDQGSPKIRAMAQTIEDLGGGIDDSLASAGDKFGTLGTLFDAALTGIKRAVAEPILKALEEHFDDVVGFIQAGSGVIRTVIGTVVSGVASAVQTIGPLVTGLGGQAGNALVAFLPMVGSLVETLTSLATIVGPVLAGALAILVPALQVVGDLLSWILGLVSRLLEWIAQGVASLTEFVGVTTSAGRAAQTVVGASAGSAAATNAAGGDGSGRPAAGVTVNQNNTFNLNEQRVAQEVAKKTEPVVRAAQWQVEQRLATQAKRAAVAANLGGGGG